MNRLLSHFAGPLLALAFLFSTAVAGPGHDHDDDTPAPVNAPTAPRFEAHSAVIEVLGILEGDHLDVFVDRFADNSPVLQAKVELESGKSKVSGEFHEDSGTYRFAAEPLAEPGSHPLTLIVSVDGQVERLTANLVVPDDHEENGHDETDHQWERFGVGAAALLALFALLFGILRLKKRRSAGGLK